MFNVAILCPDPCLGTWIYQCIAFPVFRFFPAFTFWFMDLPLTFNIAILCSDLGLWTRLYNLSHRLTPLNPFTLYCVMRYRFSPTTCHGSMKVNDWRPLFHVRKGNWRRKHMDRYWVLNMPSLSWEITLYTSVCAAAINRLVKAIV